MADERSATAKAAGRSDFEFIGDSVILVLLKIIAILGKPLHKAVFFGAGSVV
jgi:hypothetical protein